MEILFILALGGLCIAARAILDELTPAVSTGPSRQYYPSSQAGARYDMYNWNNGWSHYRNGNGPR
jgi:hypothetical protein